jgi:hypothetical protein
VRIHEIKAMPEHLLRRAQQVSAAIFTEALAEQDVSSVQYLALAALTEPADLTDAVPPSSCACCAGAGFAESRLTSRRAGAGFARNSQTVKPSGQGAKEQ